MHALFAAMLCVGLALSGGISAAPATAIDYPTLLCKGYKACANAGMPNSGYSAVSGTSYWNMYPGHNCTNYAAYRLIQDGASYAKPWKTTGNAYNWGVARPDITDQNISVGSIAWWGSPKGNHVAYVEYVDATRIIVSEDNWGGDFQWRSIPRSLAYTTSSYWPSGFMHFTPQSQATMPAGMLDWSAGNGTVTYWKTTAQKARINPAKVKPGQRIWVTSTWQNTGTQTWSNVALGVAAPQGGDSALAESWPDTTRTPSQIEDAVISGGTASFGFWVRVPATQKRGTTITESYRPVAYPGGSYPDGAAGSGGTQTAPIDAPTWVAANPITVSLTVPKITTKATVTLSNNLKKHKSSGKVTVTVKTVGASGALPKGTIRLRDGSKLLKKVKITAANKGRFTVTLRKLAKRTHKLSVTFTPASEYLASTAYATLKVTRK